MSNDFTDAAPCDGSREDLTDLALGLLTGRERSELLDHVETCAACAGELARLSVVADTIIQLVPDVEPPVGFETRLLERLHDASPLGRGRRHLRSAAIAAGAAVIAAAVGFSVARAMEPSPKATPSYLTSANLTSHGHDVGEVVLSQGKFAWMFMAIESGRSSTVVWCTVTLSDGRRLPVGEFRLVSGYGTWGAPLPSVDGRIVSASVTGPSGAIIATASL